MCDGKPIIVHSFNLIKFIMQKNIEDIRHTIMTLIKKKPK